MVNIRLPVRLVIVIRHREALRVLEEITAEVQDHALVQTWC